MVSWFRESPFISFSMVHIPVVGTQGLPVNVFVALFCIGYGGYPNQPLTATKVVWSNLEAAQDHIRVMLD